jgi:hypothetical protein
MASVRFFRPGRIARKADFYEICMVPHGKYCDCVIINISTIDSIAKHRNNVCRLFASIILGILPVSLNLLNLSVYQRDSRIKMTGRK